MSNAITPEEMESLFADAAASGQFPAHHAGKGISARLKEWEIIEDCGPLTQDHLDALEAHVATGNRLGTDAPDLKKLRWSHHRIAQYMAIGLPNTQVAAMCGITPEYVSQLQADPAFGELLAFYGEGVKEEFADVVTRMSDLSLDFLQLLQERLNERPEEFKPSHVLEAIRTLTDRTGHAPVTKSVNVNVNTGLGDRLRLARERAASVYIEGTATHTGTDG